MGKDKIIGYQHLVLKILSGKISEFYLAGGTALSLFYFQHRVSVDLDFFTQDFTGRRIKEIVEYLQGELRKRIELVGQRLQKESAKQFIYHIHFNARDILKIDFVEDVFELIKPTKIIEGIRILSLEDIYIRKLYAVCGAIYGMDEVGRKKALGGRREAKDFYDLYLLSHTFMAMSKFVTKYGSPIMIEGLIGWFRTYDRMNIIEGILTLDINNSVDYKIMEKHFKMEIDKITESQLEGI